VRSRALIGSQWRSGALREGAARRGSLCSLALRAGMGCSMAEMKADFDTAVTALAGADRIAIAIRHPPRGRGSPWVALLSGPAGRYVWPNG